ncbi:NUDIX hydrolase [Nocardioides sambongensis]|uniref:hypothetical protein n=1 Tax=Nocardioides sambongensis TaxID=2589074 RepID=UPI001E343C51|nr:hypothetical protein [Nocardioides sambongensis]
MADPASETFADRPESWPVLGSEDLHRDSWVVALRSDLMTRPNADGEAPFRRLVLEHPGAAVVLAIDEEDRVLCLAQYRHPAQHRLVELPAGVCDHPGRTRCRSRNASSRRRRRCRPRSGHRSSPPTARPATPASGSTTSWRAA